MFIVISSRDNIINFYFNDYSQNSQEDELYWPVKSPSLTFDYTTVIHRGTEVNGETTILQLETQRFGKVINIFTSTSVLLSFV